MARWEPNARGRLQEAALELFRERGYEQTTVAGIAERAGLTERTFFRHFADKREVLFAGGEVLQETLVGALADAPPAAAPIDAVAIALGAAGPLFEERRGLSAPRQAIIDANPELQERELIKLAHLAAALAEGLRERGVEEPAASLVAQAGLAVFRSAFARWIDPDNDEDFPALVRASLRDLRGVTGAATG